MSASRLTKGIYKAVATLGGDALEERALTLLVRFFKKIRCVVLATGVRV